MQTLPACAAQGGGGDRRRRSCAQAPRCWPRACATVPRGCHHAGGALVCCYNRVVNCQGGPAAGGLCIMHNASSFVQFLDCVPRCSVILPHLCFHLLSCCALVFPALYARVPEDWLLPDVCIMQAACQVSGQVTASWGACRKCGHCMGCAAPCCRGWMRRRMHRSCGIALRHWRCFCKTPLPGHHETAATLSCCTSSS